MRPHFSRSIAALVPVVAAFVLAAAARPAAAQTAARAEPTGTHRTDVAAAPATRTLAVYRLSRTALPGLPGEVTVADSAGSLVAHYRAPGAARGQAMTVAVMNTDLVLQAQAPTGVLTLLLERQNDASSDALTGRWWLGDRGGTLRATVAR
jgi:hypothetical protein